MGYEFYGFVQFHQSAGATPYFARPPGVEGFLPISALLGFLSIFSPVKVNRNEETCTDFQKCTKGCPHLIQVHTLDRIVSDEYTGCALCINSCPMELAMMNIAEKYRRFINRYIIITKVRCRNMMRMIN
jgi:Pyruvate/2-oxoacid:ferredoxin oxidoreductase delta subunit